MKLKLVIAMFAVATLFVACGKDKEEDKEVVEESLTLTGSWYCINKHVKEWRQDNGKVLRDEDMPPYYPETFNMYQYRIVTFRENGTYEEEELLNSSVFNQKGKYKIENDTLFTLTFHSASVIGYYTYRFDNGKLVIYTEQSGPIDENVYSTTRYSYTYRRKQ